MGIECRVMFENWYKSIGGNVEMLPDGSAYRVPSTETSWTAFRRCWIMRQAEIDTLRAENEALRTQLAINEAVADPDDLNGMGVDIDNAGRKWRFPSSRFRDDPFNERELTEIAEQGPGMVIHDSGAVTLVVYCRNQTSE